MTADIFISYRRDDTRGDAGRLNDRLVQRFGHERVFMDVDDIEPGADFVERLQTTLESCAAVVIVIGRQWCGRDEQGHSRLDNPADFVRIEVAAALDRNIPVLPVLVGGANMPRPEEIPEVLHPLLMRQAVEVRHSRFNDDVEKLAEALSVVVGGQRRRLSRRAVIALFGAGIVIAAGVGFWSFSGPGVVHLRAEPSQVTTDAARAMLVRLNFYDARLNPGGGSLVIQPMQNVIADDVVMIERSTDLMWQNSRFGRPGTQVQARDVILQANEARYAGFNDWRLPTLEEAMSLMTAKPDTTIHMATDFNGRAAPFIWTADQFN